MDHYSPHCTRKKELDEALAFFLAKDSRPTHLVQGAGFQRLIKMFDPNYKVPDCPTISKKLLPELQNEKVKELTAIVALVKWFSLTKDM